MDYKDMGAEQLADLLETVDVGKIPARLLVAAATRLRKSASDYERGAREFAEWLDANYDTYQHRLDKRFGWHWQELESWLASRGTAAEGEEGERK